MPRRPFRSGRPDYPQPLGPAWVEAAQPVMEWALNGEVEVRAPDRQTGYDPVTHQPVIELGALIYSGRARLQQVGDDTRTPLAGQDVTTRRYRLSIELRAQGLKIGQLARFTKVVQPEHDSSADWSWLVGRKLTVTAIDLATTAWSHDLLVEDNLG